MGAAALLMECGGIFFTETLPGRTETQSGCCSGG